METRTETPAMGMEAFVDYLEGRFAAQISSHTVIEPTTGEFEDFPEALDPRLVNALQSSGLKQLYSHQSEAFESIRRGQDTVLVSKTASGRKNWRILRRCIPELLAEAELDNAMLKEPASGNVSLGLASVKLHALGILTLS